MEKYSPKLTALQEKRIRRAKLADSIQIMLFILVLAVLFLSALNDNVALGELIVGCFAVIGLLFHIKSDRVFKLAFVTLVAIPVTTLFSPYTDTAENMAVFSFLLLVVGVGFSLLDLFRTKSNRKHKP